MTMDLTTGNLTAGTLKAGDFSRLADDYSRYRPGYSPSALAAVTGLLGRPTSAGDAVDIGAGTGIWTRMLAEAGFRTVTAVEPNDRMREMGCSDPRNGAIGWRKGAAEDTGLDDASADLLSMASSFHWADFDRATAEFHRVLRPGGLLVLLWNPRLIEANPLLVEIEDHLKTLLPGLTRVSSGRSGITERLTRLLERSAHFSDVVYIEGRHSVEQSIDHYLGAWRSVSDVQSQLGPVRFQAFLDWTAETLRGHDRVHTTYLTRVWVCRNAVAATMKADRPGSGPVL